MRLELLATLKEKLQTATEFTDVLSYFFDHFGEDPAFHDQGKRIADPGLERLLQETLKSMLDEPVQLSRVLFIRLKKYHFVHGGFAANGDLGNILFFDDIQMGLISLVVSRTGETKMARITMRRLPPLGHD